MAHSPSHPIDITQKCLIENKDINFVIQINGKTRDVIVIKKDITESDLMKIIFNNIKLNKYLNEKKIKKTIFIQNKIINLII